MDLPLLEDGSHTQGVIDRCCVVADVDVSERAVLCSFGDVLRDVASVSPEVQHAATVTGALGSTPVWEPVWTGGGWPCFNPGSARRWRRRS